MNRMMKKAMNTLKKRRFTLILGGIISLIAILVIPYASSYLITLAQENKGEVELLDTKEKFTILEIVPHLRLSEIGYLVGGQEPIDIKKAYEEKAFDQNFFGGGNENYTEVLIDEGKYVLTASEKALYRRSGKLAYELVTKTQTGYFQKIDDKSGNYELKRNVDSTPEKYEFIAMNTGGDYKWVEAEPIENLITDYDADQVWIKDQKIEYYETRVIKNSEYFKKICLGLTTDEKLNSVDVVVVSKTPDILTSQDIKDADIVYVSSKSHIGGLPEVWDNYKKNENSENKSEQYSGNDISWKLALELFMEVAINDKKLPIVMDAGIVDAGITGSSLGSLNIQKLYIMLRRMNPIVFYNLYLNDNTDGDPNATKIDTIISKETGEFKKDGTWISKWEENTWFLPKGISSWSEKDALMLSQLGFINGDHLNSVTTSNTSLNFNIYTYNSNTSLPQTFAIPSGEINDTNPFTKELFEFLKKSDPSAIVDNTTTPAIAVKYILGYNKGLTPEVKKATMTILDLEPCNEFNLSIEDVRKMIPTFTGAIKIVQQTTATFNGKIEDLNKEYDMIYMGMNYGQYTTEWLVPTSGEGANLPKYNDTALNGKIYLHVGDQVKSYNSNYNIKWGELREYSRLPGNDITELKKKDLNGYIDAGYPIIVHDDLYYVNTPRTKRFVDDSSTIYKFIKNQIDTNNPKNLIAMQEVNKNENLTSYIGIIKPKIIMINSPTVYKGNPDPNGKIPGEAYLNNINSSDRTLNYEFKISDNSLDNNNLYTAVLFVDINADGRFAENEKFKTISNLIAGSDHHTLTYKLGKEYYGVIPWKLLIYNQNNSNIRTELIETSAIKKEGKRKELNILQVNTNTNYTASTLNIQENINNKGLFYKYTKDLNDFEIIVETISVWDFERLFNQGEPFKKDDKKNTDKLTEYDMLIFGFGDRYSNISNTYGAADNIQYYIELGKSVLFTHDNTSLNNTSNASEKFNYGLTFTTSFRDILGMDRFGARKSETEIGEYDKATKPNGGIYEYQTHGYTYFALNRIGSTKHDNPWGNPNLVPDSTNPNKVPIFKGLAYKEYNSETSTVSRVNEGQITQYPYYINEEIKVAPTHAQWYQLDLNKEDIVVWYCLKDDATDNANEKAYDYSPNDASNNYYIYNKGNITYSGVGHSNVAVDGNDEEIKLFVNTMIAAYKAGYSAPYVEIMNEEAILLETNKYVVYVDYVLDNENFTKGDILPIKFKAFDPNFSTGDLLITDITIDGNSIKDTDIYDSEKNKLTDKELMHDKQDLPENKRIKIKREKEYYFNYDKVNLNNKSTNKVIITVENEKGLEGSVEVVLSRCALFDLD